MGPFYYFVHQQGPSDHVNANLEFDIVIGGRNRSVKGMLTGSPSAPPPSPRLIFFACSRSSPPLSESLEQATGDHIGSSSSTYQISHSEIEDIDIAPSNAAR